MAHIEVIRRSMRPEEWTRLRFGWLKRGIYENKSEITGLEIRDARQVTENTYEYYSEDFRPLSRGDIYFTPDGTVFMRARAALPPEMRGGEVWLYYKTPAEICVKVNGKYAGGVDPNRERILISPYIGDNAEFELEMTGYNRSKPDDERSPEILASRGCRQEFGGVFLARVNNSVQQLVWDFEVLLNIAESDCFPADYRAFLNRALNKAMDCVEFEDDYPVGGIEAAREDIESEIYSNKTYRGSGSVALTGHSHLDIAYYWRRIHAVQKNLRTVLIQLRLMDKYPDFRFTHTQPYLYETLEKYYPEVFSELCERVREGRFEPVGAMYVEPDCNIPSAESLIRQCLYGQLTYKRMFGKTVNNAWLPDVFGNSWILPQILRKSGAEYFVSNKMSTWNDTNRFPHNNFIWRGIDGSEVYACVPPTHFISWNEPAQVQRNWDAFIDKDSGGQTLSMFGYGDGGSGCTEAMLEAMKRFKKLSIMPETEHMGGEEFLEKNLKNNTELKTWDGELYLEMHRGTFTTKSELKRLNRMLENKLRTAELLSVMRGEENRAELTALWKKFLVNQFHDILPGSHIHPVYEDALRDYTEIDSALGKIIGSGEKYFNTLNFTRSLPVFIRDENGSCTRKGLRGCFVYPGFSALSGGEIEKEDFGGEWFTFEKGILTTDYYRIKLAPDGSFSSLLDRKLSREWADDRTNKLALYRDCSGNYDAWDILPDYASAPIPLTISEHIRLYEADGECVSFKAELCTEKSKITRIIRFFRRFRGIEVEHLIDWHESHRLLRAEFSWNILTRKALCDTSAGYIERETHRNTSWQQARFEVCMHNWCDMSETGGGVAVLNEGKYGAGFEENRMGISLLRATERPDVNSDTGVHSFCYMLLPHEGDAVAAGVNRAALEYNAPLVKTDARWNLPAFEPLIQLAAKSSESGEMTVLRLSEQNGSRGTIKLPFAVRVLDMLEQGTQETDEINYKPFEIITIGIEHAFNG